jgi:hypothetical protein
VVVGLRRTAAPALAGGLAVMGIHFGQFRSSSI